MKKTEETGRAAEHPLAEGIDLDDFLPYLLNRISNRLNLDLTEELRTIGATLPMWRVLAVLQVLDGRAIGELSVYTVIEQSTLSRIIDRMQQAGLVERRPRPEDGRVIEVFISDEGRDMHARIVPIALKHYRRAIDGLDPAQHDALIDTLHRILDNVRATPYP